MGLVHAWRCPTKSQKFQIAADLSKLTNLTLGLLGHYGVLGIAIYNFQP